MDPVWAEPGQQRQKLVHYLTQVLNLVNGKVLLPFSDNSFTMKLCTYWILSIPGLLLHIPCLYEYTIHTIDLVFYSKAVNSLVRITPACIAGIPVRGEQKSCSRGRGRGRYRFLPLAGFDFNGGPLAPGQTNGPLKCVTVASPGGQ